MNTQVQQTPIEAGNLRPAEIIVSTCLAQDTIIGTSPDIASGRNKVALFANPFADDMEEMLYVDTSNRLVWARHSNVGTTTGINGAAGWTTEVLAGNQKEVVVAVHPNGSVWAYSLHAVDLPVSAFVLVVDEYGVKWMQVHTPLEVIIAQHISVQYMNDRPATPMVATVTAGGRLTVITPTYETDSLHMWGDWDYLVDAQLGLSADELANPIAVGVDPGMATVRVYTQSVTSMEMRSVDVATGSVTKAGLNVVIDRIIGVWTHPQIAGCICTTDSYANVPSLLLYARPTDGKDVIEQWLMLDQALSDRVAWQDEKGRLHVYGRAFNGGLYGAHQLGWVEEHGKVYLRPTWDTHAVTGKPFPEAATTRALVANVAAFAVDAYPDAMPNQHVMHAQVIHDGERCALYTQSLDGSYWSDEKIRLVMDALKTPYVVSRYQVVASVKNAYGSVQPGIELSITADDLIDMEIRGGFYRAGPDNEVRVQTDLTGRAILRILPNGLTMPRLHISAIGVEQSVTVNPAATMHKFLGGGGPLANHPEGFVADTVTNATKPGGGFLFEHIHRYPSDPPSLPTAQNIVDWCGFALSPQKLELKTGPGGKRIAGMCFQVHDKSRPAFEVFESDEAAAAARSRLRGIQGISATSGLFEWPGDLWQGIREGLIQVGEVSIYVGQATVDFVVYLADGTRAFFSAAWDRLKGAPEAVEAIFNAVGAYAQDTIDWLAWAFDFKDVWDTKKALESGLAMFPPLLRQTLEWCRANGNGWFDNKESDIRQAFATFKATFTTQSMGQFSTPSLGEGRTPPDGALALRGAMQCGHVAWLYEYLIASALNPAGGLVNVKARATNPATNPLTNFANTVQSLPVWDALQPAIRDAEAAFNAIFSPEDANTGASAAFVSVIGVFEELIVAALSLGNQIFDAMITLVEETLDLLQQYLNEPIGVPFLQTIYDFIQIEAGVPLHEREILTAGHLGVLIGAYPATVVYKAVFGSAPFPGGQFPDLQRIASVANATGPGGDPPAGSITPYQWELLKAFQGYCGIMMDFDIVFDEVLNAGAFAKMGEIGKFTMPGWWWKGWAVNHVIAYAIGDCPKVWGIRLPYEVPQPADAQIVLPSAMWAVSAVANSIDACCAWGWEKFITEFEDDEKGFGAQFFAICGMTRIVMSLIRYGIASDRGSDIAIQNVCINVTSFVSATTGFVRWLYLHKVVDPNALVIKGFLDLVCDFYAGAATVWQIAWEDKNRPRFDDDHRNLPSAKYQQQYHQSIGGVAGGFPPYSWDSQDVQSPAPGFIGTMPSGLTINADTGVISGSPDKPGRYQFLVVMGDDYGPTFYYQNYFTIDVELPE